MLDVWRIDDEWWRDKISQRYFELVLKDGTPIIVYQNLVSGEWLQQRYELR